MSASLLADSIAHLWQSTLIITAVWLLTIALRSNRARVRHTLWMMASVKLLVPFSWLVSLLGWFTWPATPTISQPAMFVVEQVLTPRAFVAAPATAPALAVATLPSSYLLFAVWGAGAAVVLFWWWRQWQPIRAALREAVPLDIAPEYGVGDLTVMSSPSACEPGVIGIWRPILLLPDGLTARFTPAQLKAVIAHERCHIRCRDNLAAALHMLVETLFWFHPLVWWIERRLIEERERACDEAVLDAGNDAADYAEGILTVCRFTVRSPLVCVTGVTGSDLRRRLEAIMRYERGLSMTLSRRVAVGVVTVVLVGMPIAAGVVSAIPLLAVGQEPSARVVFDAAAVRRSTSGENSASFDDRPGGRFEATNTPLHRLILEAYRISDDQLVNAPDWTRSERYDVNAKLEQEAPIVRGAESGQRQLALRSLLAERFKLAVHRETRQVPMYALVMARADRRLGPALRPASADCSPDAVQARIEAARSRTAPAGPAPGMCGRRVTSGRIDFGGYSLAEFARAFRYGDRPVIDRTGLTGNWEFVLTFAPDTAAPPPGQVPSPVDPDAPSLTTALQEQLGLKLEPIRGSIEVLVVDHVERLSD